MTEAGCFSCPRGCGKRRELGEEGWCAVPTYAPVIAAICRHLGEEPVLGGEAGVVNVFFAHCNLACVHCQNADISDTARPLPPARTVRETVRTIERILEEGARAVGFVSPSHQVHAMSAIIQEMRARGITVPVIYNTSAYDAVPALQSLEGLVDIWLPDYKYADAALAERLSGRADYPVRALRAIREMYRQTGSSLDLDDGGLAVRGLIIRHLILPGALDNAKACLRAIAEDISTRVSVSLMAQYHPKNKRIPRGCAISGSGKAQSGGASLDGAEHNAPDRALLPIEYEEVAAYFFELGFRNGFVQELASHEAFLPDFSRGEQAFEP